MFLRFFKLTKVQVSSKRNIKTLSKTKKPASMFRIRICIVVHLVLVTWNWWNHGHYLHVLKAMVVGCCWCGNKSNTQKILEANILPKYLKRDLNQPKSENPLANNIWRRISTQKVHPKEISIKNNCQEWKLKFNKAFFPLISPVLIFFYVSCHDCLQFCCWRCFFIFGKRFLFRTIFHRGFSSDFLAGNCLLKDFLVEISLHIFEQRMSLQSFLGRVFWRKKNDRKSVWFFWDRFFRVFFAEISLYVVLGTHVSSSIFW